MDLEVEVDSRENCFGSVNQSDFESLHGGRAVVQLLGSETDPTRFVTVSVGPSVGRGKLRIGKLFATAINLKPGSTVICSVEKVIVDAKNNVSSMATLRPCSADDWELVESRSVFIEENLIEQIAVLFAGLRFPVWIGRGSKPVCLEVVSLGGAAEYQLLHGGVEIAIEVVHRRVLDNRLTSESTTCLHARVIDSGFPADDADFSSAGFIVCAAAFPHSVVTVRGRPEIVSLIAVSSALVDPGVVLVSPVMRDRYGLRSGDRIVLESVSESELKNVRIPKKVTLYAGSDVDNVSDLFRIFLESANTIVVPQGGWLGVHADNETQKFIKIHFELSNCGASSIALISAASLKDMQIEVAFLSSDETETKFTRSTDPALKYIPEKVRENGLLCPSTSRSAYPPLPSFTGVVDRIKFYLESCLVNAPLEGPFVSSVLVSHAQPNSGKRTVLRQALDRLDPLVPYVSVDCVTLGTPSLFTSTEVVETLAGLLRFGFENPPFAVLFERADVLFAGASVDQTIDEPSSIQRKMRSKLFLVEMDKILASIQPNRSLLLLGTALEKDSSDELLARLFIHLERLPRKLSKEDRDMLGGMTSDTTHCVGEILDWKNESVRKSLISCSKSLLSNRVCHTIAALSDQYSTLTEAITLPLLYPLLFRGSAVVASRGALIVGPTGTGKSALIDQVVASTGLPVEIVRGPDLLDKYIGASEQGVRQVFEKAASIAPSIIVFDGIESLCPRRGSEHTGVTDRVVNQMLCYLDGVEKTLENVFVIAITSRPDMVDPALTRPGRLDLTVLCDIPGELEKRVIIKSLWQCDYLSDELLEDSQLEELAQALAPTCTGADIRAGFVNGRILAKRRKEPLSFRHVLEAFRNVKPAIAQSDLRWMEHLYGKYRKGGGTHSSVPPQVGTKTRLC